MRFLRFPLVLRIRECVANIRKRIDPFYIAKWKRIRQKQIEYNLPYEQEQKGYWRPVIMGLEETLRYIIDSRCSVSRFGDGELELIAGRDMLFEEANARMGQRLAEILSTPQNNCLCCIPNSYGSLARYIERDIPFWRDFALWSRPVLQKYLHSDYIAASPQMPRVLGDPQISRAYMGIADKTIAPRVFALWKELFKDKDILLVEGRFSRLGIGNDLFHGARSVRRIWCPHKGAFALYDDILSAIKSNAKVQDLILLALGATATILSYDLAKLGYWAIDVGHLDVEYMWMKMGATEKIAIPGRYVSEVTGAQEQNVEIGEEMLHSVIAKIGC